MLLVEIRARLTNRLSTGFTSAIFGVETAAIASVADTARIVGVARNILLGAAGSSPASEIPVSAMTASAVSRIDFGNVLAWTGFAPQRLLTRKFL